jgi:hypothetical protein
MPARLFRTAGTRPSAATWSGPWPPPGWVRSQFEPRRDATSFERSPALSVRMWLIRSFHPCCPMSAVSRDGTVASSQREKVDKASVAKQTPPSRSYTHNVEVVLVGVSEHVSRAAVRFGDPVAVDEHRRLTSREIGTRSNRRAHALSA